MQESKMSVLISIPFVHSADQQNDDFYAATPGTPTPAYVESRKGGPAIVPAFHICSRPE